MSETLSDLKLCINCKHHSCEPDYRNYNGLTVNEYGVMPDVCKAPQNVKGIEPVRGHTLLIVPECNEQRALESTDCGFVGNWWEAKPPKSLGDYLNPKDKTDKYADL